MLALSLCASLLGACSRGEPPGRRFDTEPSQRPLARPVETASAAVSAEAPAVRPEQLEPGSGAKIASIAMRTWIYDEPRERGYKLGYLRAGAVVDRAELSGGSEGCEGGWYRVLPRGYVCVGKGATLALDHPIPQAAARGPQRGEPLPYVYAISDSPPPHMYFQLPTVGDQQRVEGRTYTTHVALKGPRWASQPTDSVPSFLLQGEKLPHPYGSEKNLAYSVHRGKARENSAFGLMSVFEWQERKFGLTTELDLIPLDRTKPAKASEFSGVLLPQGGAPAFALRGGTTSYVEKNGQYIAGQAVAGRSGFELTGKSHGGDRGLLETTSGIWLPAAGVITTDLRKDRAGRAEKGKKWISVSINKQLLVAYEGDKPVYATLVSTGRGGMSDPSETHATIRGTFMIRAKHVSGTMDGDEGSDESFDLRDVPYIQYFHEGYALHAAYWHDDFGKERSHGCVNLAPKDAAWIFDWTDPPVPKDWHGAVAPQGGTLVYVHK